MPTMTALPNTLDRFTEAYLDCALWSSTDESTESGGYPLDANYTIADFAPEAIERAIADCKRFQAENSADLGAARGDRYNGHDFWLTRNGHGCGFWDRDLGAVGDRLSEACNAFGETWLYVGDDGRLYFC